MIAHDTRRNLKNLIDDLCLEAYNEGVDAGRALVPAPARGEEALKQIDRMARQIEECHATLRRRNQRIKALESDLNKATAEACPCLGVVC